MTGVKVNICGYEAVEDGLRAGGIERFLCSVAREPLCNAEKALCRGYFFASDNHKTACVISEQDALAIKCTMIPAGKLNAGMEIIVLGKEISDSFLRTAGNFGIPVMIPESVNDIRNMTHDAVMYSELKGAPVAVYIPVRLMRSRQTAWTDGTFFCDCLCSVGYTERDGRIHKLEDRYNTLCRSVNDADDRQCLIICMPGCTGTVRQLAGSLKGVDICRFNMFGCEHYRKTIKEYSKVLILGHGCGYACDILKEKKLIRETGTAAALSGDILHEAAEIYSILKEFLPGRRLQSFGSDGIAEAVSRMARPPVRPVTDIMCADCPYRSHIQDIMADCPETVMYEDIYCEKRGTLVRSGMSRSYSAYSSGLVITNRSGSRYDGMNTRYITHRCGRTGTDTMPVDSTDKNTGFLR